MLGGSTSITFNQNNFIDDKSSDYGSNAWTGCGLRAFAWSKTESMWTFADDSNDSKVLSLAPTVASEVGSWSDCTITVTLVDYPEATPFEYTLATCEVTECEVTFTKSISISDYSYTVTDSTLAIGYHSSMFT